MGRIRTIKPEFPQSESMGRISREGRLCFILLWTLADDEGRLRGNSRMLASLLYPYDDDAAGLMESWLSDLEKEDCLKRYKHEGDSYIQICNWLKHQKIDKPSKSKIRAFDEPSLPFANPLEPSCGDQGSRIKDQGEDQGELSLSGKERKIRPEDFANEWNKHRGPLPKVTVFTDERKKKVLARMKSGVTLERFTEAVRNCRAKPHLRGDNGWTADFDWLVKNSTNIEKAINNPYGANGEINGKTDRSVQIATKLIHEVENCSGADGIELLPGGGGY